MAGQRNVFLMNNRRGECVSVVPWGCGVSLEKESFRVKFIICGSTCPRFTSTEPLCLSAENSLQRTEPRQRPLLSTLSLRTKVSQINFFTRNTPSVSPQCTHLLAHTAMTYNEKFHFSYSMFLVHCK